MFSKLGVYECCLLTVLKLPDTTGHYFNLLDGANLYRLSKMSHNYEQLQQICCWRENGQHGH